MLLTKFIQKAQLESDVSVLNFDAKFAPDLMLICPK